MTCSVPQILLNLRSGQPREAEIPAIHYEKVLGVSDFCSLLSVDLERKMTFAAEHVERITFR
jgi:hypothetical protein